MRKQSKTRKVAVIDGHRYMITKQGKYWHYRSDHGFSHLDMLKAHVEREGGHIEVVPNPNYREPSPFELLDQLFRGK